MKMWVWIIATALIVLGLVLIVGVLGYHYWDFSILNTMNYQTNTHDLTQAFSDISLKTDTADVVFLPSEDESCRVVCREPEKIAHKVYVEDGTLHISIEDSRAWFEYIGINFGSSKITVYLPQSAYVGLIIQGSTGDIKITDEWNFRDVDLSVSTGVVHTKGFSAESVTVKVSTGRIIMQSVACEKDISVNVSTGNAQLKDVSCRKIVSDGSTGRISMTEVIVQESLNIVRTTGDVYLEDCDASELSIQTTTGNVKGSLLTDKIFFTKTSTGRIKVPRSITGGPCHIKTSTGNIDFEFG